MRSVTLLPLVAALLLVIPASALAASHLMRFADVHGDQVVFTYEGDLWLASTAGGDARRITSDPGEERYARFSPEGSQIAFTGNYDGGTDVYVMDAGGGVPRRLTFHPAADNVLDWFPDGKAILFRSRRTAPFAADQLYRVAVEGGTEERLPVDRAGLTALSPDGTAIAYNRISREFATWKRYRGGQAQAIWMGSLARGDFRKITDGDATNSWPMWQGGALFFVSDRQWGTMNLYRYDLATRQTVALTQYRDYDVKYPSIGPGAIVFQYGERLHLLDLTAPGASPRQLDIRIPTDLVGMRPWFVDSDKDHGAFALSPNGSHLLLEVRGEILSVPAEKGKGEPVNLTRTSGSREKDAAWSPDGRRVAFLSDVSGEEEVCLADPRGTAPFTPLTRGNQGFRTRPVWSPDSKWLLFTDKAMRLNLVDAATGAVQAIAQGEFDDGWERWGIQDYVWSPDSRWIAYTRMNENLNETIQLYSLATRRTFAVTDDRFTSWSPSFDPKGRYLYFLSNRTFAPIMGAVDQNHIFLDMCRPYAVVLKAGAASPFAPAAEEPATGAVKKDEAAEKDDGGKKEGAGKKADAGKAEAVPPVVVDTDDFERRTVVAPGIEAGDYFRLEASPKGFLFLAQPKRHFDKYMVVTDQTAGELDLYGYDLEPEKPGDWKAEKLVSGLANYHLSADGKKLVYRAGGAYGVLEAGKSGKSGDGAVSLADVRIKIDRAQEYAQIFNEAWRVQRDWFYDPGLHGLDWEAVGAMYRKFVPDCGTRSDLVYLIGEMISELNAGHTYSYGGDDQADPRRMATGLLGADFEVTPGAAYPRIGHVVPGFNWDEAETSPLAAPDCPIRAGDYLIAVDGQELSPRDNLYAALEGKAGRVVTLTFNGRPTRTGARTCRVRAIASEQGIRYREWVERNRAYVEQATGGQVGYLHIPDMGENGLREFARGFHAQHLKQALVIDERYNGGGFVGDMIVDRMERQLWAITLPREGKVGRNPEGVFRGHYALLINENTGSNGEYFAEAIKLRGLAKSFGMRTWGGAVGIEVHQPLVDGGTCTPPQFAAYDLQRRWVIEGHGVDPDVEVQNLPGDVLRGKDAQLDAAIAYLRERLAAQPMALPPPPAYPNKAK
ncbi:MAG: PD40 domain-containing protein [Candidatus Eisenbacteria bacterium]|nr:PD40 domain-containing protein [Candidatus Eisenbacteria bacterium]